ncbi:unnamed protein product, partial [Urochloa humidicola]
GRGQFVHPPSPPRFFSIHRNRGRPPDDDDLLRLRTQGRNRKEEEAKMIYRNWSLLSSTVVIWGGVATAGLAGIFLFGGKEKFQDYLCREGERLRQQDRARISMGRD